MEATSPVGRASVDANSAGPRRWLGYGETQQTQSEEDSAEEAEDKALCADADGLSAWEMFAKESRREEDHGAAVHAPEEARTRSSLRESGAGKM